MKLAGHLLMLGLIVLFAGCSVPARHMKQLQLGMTPDQVRKAAGNPYTIRGAKVYEDGRSLEVWEYISWLAIFPKDYWVMFQNGKVVQWGEPGDFGSQAVENPPMSEYIPTRVAR